MRKNKLFILFSVLIIISVFATAATCNLCGTQDDIKNPEKDSNSSGENRTNEQTSASGVTESTRTVTADTEEGEDTEALDEEENNQPVIESININGIGITEDYWETPAGEESVIEVSASDADGDTLIFTNDSSCGDISEIRVTGETATFGWRAPDSTELCTVTVFVSDGIEEVSRRIDIGVYELEEGGTGRTARPLHGTVHSGLCGYIVKNESAYPPDDMLSPDGAIFIGDTSNKREAKGYISFDISDTWESNPGSEINIEFVNLSINNITQSNNPSDVGQYLVIKEEKYGTEFTMDIFSYEGRYLAQFPTAGLTNLSITNDTLIEALETAVNNEEQYFQIKLGLSSPTNEDTMPDGFWINLGEVRLSGGYNIN